MQMQSEKERVKNQTKKKIKRKATINEFYTCNGRCSAQNVDLILATHSSCFNVDDKH